MVLLLVDASHRVVLARAVDLREPNPSTFSELASRGDLELHASYFRCSLDELRLSAGPLDVRPSSLRVSLPPPLAAQRFALAGSGPSSWSAISDPAAAQAELAELSLGDDHLCAIARPTYRVVTSSVFGTTGREAESLMMLDGRSVLARAPLSPTFVRASAAGVLRADLTVDGSPPSAAACSESATGVCPQPLVALSNGTLWGFDGFHKTLYSGSWSTAGGQARLRLESPASSSPFPNGNESTAAGSSPRMVGDLGELFMWVLSATSASSDRTNHQIFARFVPTSSSGAWELPSNGPSQTESMLGLVDDMPPKLLLSGQAQALAMVVGAGCPCVIRYEDGAINVEKVPAEMYAGVTAIGTSTAFGDLAATVGGAIFFHRAAEWIPLVPSSSTGATPISALTAIGGSVIYADGDGRTAALGEFGTSYGACPLPDVHLSGHIRDLIPIDAGAHLAVMSQLLLVSPNGMGTHLAPTLTVYERTPPPSCLFDTP
jgi:hypothetical protein